MMERKFLMWQPEFLIMCCFLYLYVFMELTFQWPSFILSGFKLLPPFKFLCIVNFNSCSILAAKILRGLSFKILIRRI